VGELNCADQKKRLHRTVFRLFPGSEIVMSVLIDWGTSENIHDDEDRDDVPLNYSTSSEKLTRWVNPCQAQGLKKKRTCETSWK
jgi:hypothetical protein